MSVKGDQARVDMRNQAVGMCLTGKSTREVGKYFSLDHSLVSRWLKKRNNETCRREAIWEAKNDDQNI